MTRILVTGSDGLVGSAFKRLSNEDYHKYNFQFIRHADYDLCKQSDVKSLFKYRMVDVVVHCAGLVGSSQMNNSHQADLFYQNMMMNTLLLEEAKVNNVQQLFVFSSASAYPDNKYTSDELYAEDDLHLSQPNERIYAYGYAKRMLDIQVRTYREQHKLRGWHVLIPPVIYGKNDNFSLLTGQFIPSFMHKAFLARQTDENLKLCTDGATRELLYADDVVHIIIQMIEKEVQEQTYNITSGQSVTVSEVAYRIADLMGVRKSRILCECNQMPNCSKKLKATKLMRIIDTYPFVKWADGLKLTTNWFIENYHSIRC